jgi:hypothetical protein
MWPSLRVLTVRRVINFVTKNINKSRKPGQASDREGLRSSSGSSRAEQLATDLHLSNRAALTDLAAGDIVFLDDFAYLREAFAPNFVAVLACPLSGGAPIVCTSKVCSGLFRIVSEAQIVSMPPM